MIEEKTNIDNYISSLDIIIPPEKNKPSNFARIVSTIDKAKEKIKRIFNLIISNPQYRLMAIWGFIILMLCILSIISLFNQNQHAQYIGEDPNARQIIELNSFN